jgi:hypothetical protein
MHDNIVGHQTGAPLAADETRRGILLMRMRAGDGSAIDFRRWQ